jgi:hypothetical protein
MDRYGYRLTSRDQAIVCLVGRWNGVEARQIATWFEMDEAHVYRRTGLLVRCGLVEYGRLLHGRPGVYTATRAGLDWVNLDLPVGRPRLATYEHNVELVWLSMDLAWEFSSAAVLTEREIRSREMPAAWDSFHDGSALRPKYSVATRSRRGPRGLHFPDMLVENGGPKNGSLAVELELTSKGAGRRRQIIGAYRNGVHIEGVRYYAPPEPLRLLERTVDEERAGDVVELRPWEPRSRVVA